MTIEKGIRTLAEILSLGHEDWLVADCDAIRLGIEGLKRLLGDREAIPGDKFFRLPGETD